MDTPEENKPEGVKSNLLIPGSIIVAGLIIAFAVIYVSGGVHTSTTTPPPSGATPPPPAKTAPPSAQTLMDGEDPVIGKPDAKVTVVEFSDFQCPFCGSFFTNTLPQVKANYIATGKIRFVYRDFPLSSIHAEAEKAAEAAECASAQGKFWEYHDILFARQTTLSVTNEKKWAAELNLDTQKFNQCLDSGASAAEVAKDYADGQTLGVSGTPTFYINGQQVVGAVPYSQFQAALDAAIAATK